MNINKELLKLDKEQQALEAKGHQLLVRYGKKFQNHYDTLINKMSRATQAIDRLIQEKKDIDAELGTVRTALAYTETEV